MNQTNIKIGRKLYYIQFTYRSMKLLTEAFKLESFGDVQQKMIDLNFDKIKLDLTFKQYDFLGQVLLSGIHADVKNEDVKLTIETCTEALFNDVEKTTEIMTHFSKAVFKRLGKNLKVQPTPNKR